MTAVDVGFPCSFRVAAGATEVKSVAAFAEEMARLAVLTKPASNWFAINAAATVEIGARKSTLRSLMHHLKFSLLGGVHLGAKAYLLVHFAERSA